VLQRLNKYLLLWGIPGLLAISFFDSAAVPMVGGPDAVVLLLSWQRPMQIVWIILAAATGSTLGSLLLYRVGRLGGEMALTRFSSDRRTWVKHKLDRNAFVAVMVAVTAPPPFPTKLVILAAGAFSVSQLRFVNGVLSGRLLRYAVLAWLGARFGDQAADVLKDHYVPIILGLAVAVVVFVVVRYLRDRL